MKEKQGEHTPGPWDTGCRLTKVEVRPVGWNVPMTIADCDVAWGPETEEEKCANARLIASAPALLAACQAALDALRDAEGGDYFDAAKLETMLEQAIEAAQGEAI